MNPVESDPANMFQGFNSALSSSAEMDFSLLASNMQKFLNISEEPPAKMFKSSDPGSPCLEVAKRGKPRSCAELEDITVYRCSFCPLYFNSKALLARHALRIHHKAVVSLLQDGSTPQHLKCHFCVHKVMHKHQKLLLLHIEKKHSVEFVSFLKQVCAPPLGSFNIGNSSVPDERTVELVDGGLHNISLSDEINENAGCEIQRLSMLKKSSKEPNQSVSETGKSFPFRNLSDQVKLKVTVQSANQSCAKRKLVLDGSDCAFGNIFSLKENIPPKDSLSATLARSAWQHVEGKHFACGRCKEGFSCNALLLDHVSVRHRGPLRLLQPIFTCGLCSASFYKNSFLVRHCYRHHTPKRV